MTFHGYPMFDPCWPTVYDVGPTMDKHWVDVSCLLVYHFLVSGVCRESGLARMPRDTRDRYADRQPPVSLARKPGTRLIPRSHRSHFTRPGRAQTQSLLSAMFQVSVQALDLSRTERLVFPLFDVTSPGAVNPDARIVPA